MSRNPGVQALLETMEFPRLSEEEVARCRARYHAQYGTSGGNDMVDIPYMTGDQYDAINDAYGGDYPNLETYEVGGRADRRESNRNALKFAKAAFKFFLDNIQAEDDEFEIVEAFYSAKGEMVLPEANPQCPGPRPIIQEWCHVSFSAKPTNAGDDVSPSYFFGELLKDARSGRFNPTHCSTFEPSFDPGFRHGCLFCPAAQKCHPGPGGGHQGGRPPCYLLRYVYR